MLGPMRLRVYSDFALRVLMQAAVRQPDQIRLGERTEAVVDCHGRQLQPCRLLPACRLRSVLDEAASVLFAVLDRYTMADLVKHPATMREVLRL